MRSLSNALRRYPEEEKHFVTNVYAFIVAYGTLALWALNAVVYPIEQNRLGDL